MEQQQAAPKFGVSHVFLFLVFALIIIVVAINTGIYFYTATHKLSGAQSATNPLQQIADTTKNANNTASKMTDIVKLAPTLLAEQNSTTPKVQIVPAAPQTPATSGSATTDNSTWLTYKNDTYHFTLSYPSNLQLKQTNEGLGVTSVELRSAQNMNENDMPDYQLLLFSKTVGNIIGQNFDTYYTLSDNSSQVMKGMQGASEEQFTKLTNRTIAGLRAFDYQTTSSPPIPNEEAEVGSYIEIGDNILITSTPAENKATLEQIEASFKYPN